MHRAHETSFFNEGITLQFLCTLRVIALVVKAAASVESCGQCRLVWQALVKMLNSGLFSELNGCVSTGKEANVYQAVTAGGEDLAVKIYKTSILTFKDRDRSAACSHSCAHRTIITLYRRILQHSILARCFEHSSCMNRMECLFPLEFT